MNKLFTASNGVEVKAIPANGVVDGLELTPSFGKGQTVFEEEMQALREFFLHERDRELGRWRWPENHDYVVTPRTQKIKGLRVVRVFRESTGNVNDIREVEPIHRSDESLNAAHAYFAAHPEPKPWHDAKPGEVWLFKGKGDKEPTPFTVNTVSGLWTNPSGRELGEKYSEDRPFGYGHDPDFEPRRIWPESKES